MSSKLKLFHCKYMVKSLFRPLSSVGQSTRLIIGRSPVQVRKGPPALLIRIQHLYLYYRKVSIQSLRSFLYFAYNRSVGRLLGLLTPCVVGSIPTRLTILVLQLSWQSSGLLIHLSQVQALQEPPFYKFRGLYVNRRRNFRTY